MIPLPAGMDDSAMTHDALCEPSGRCPVDVLAVRLDITRRVADVAVWASLGLAAVGAAWLAGII